MTEILGVTDDPRHDVASGGTGLYEFRTADGVPVYLHDTTLTSLEWPPVLRRLVRSSSFRSSLSVRRRAVRRTG
ncbi:hypothetical protein [Kribbella sp. NPDC023855]|uniref:hypothetical protein n=1 Tax=Kribbella sp. NPDC023855 TaxID=3154698 RepID=UPI0033FB72A0